MAWTRAVLWPCATGIPLRREAIEQLRRAGCDEVVLLPLYPQYSSTTTGSSLNEWRRLSDNGIPVHSIDTFYDHPLYLDALVEKVDEALARFPEPNARRLCSARTACRCR